MTPLTETELDCIDQNYPTHSDIVRVCQEMIASGHYPMDNQMHAFIEQLCGLCGWRIDYTFKRIFKEPLK